MKMSSREWEQYALENYDPLMKVARKHADGDSDLAADAVQNALWEVAQFDRSKAKRNLKSLLWSVAITAIKRTVLKEAAARVVDMGEDHIDE